MAAFGVGAIPGALLAAGGRRAPLRGGGDEHGSGWPTGTRVRALTAAAGAAVVLTAYAPDTAIAFLAMAASGFLSIWFIALANTLVQVRAEPALRGRVMGVYTIALPGTLPFTGMLTSLVAQGFGPRAGFAFAGVALLATAALTWTSLREVPARAVEPAESVVC
jgi:hypothetical protein